MAEIRSSPSAPPADANLVIVGCTDTDITDGSPSAALSAFGSAVDIATVVARHGFKGSKGSSVTVSPNLVLVGLGKDDVDSRAFGKTIAATAKTNRVDSVAVAVTEAASAIDAAELSHGILTGAYESTRFKTKKEDAPEPFVLKSVDLLFDADDKAIARGTAMSKGVFVTKYLVEAPPNVCTPTHMAEAAAHISKISDRMSLTVHEKEFCEKEGMGLYLGVRLCSRKHVVRLRRVD